MYALLQAVKNAIEHRVIATRAITSPITPGDERIAVDDARGYSCGDSVCVSQNGSGEVLCIAGVDGQYLTTSPVQGTYTTDATCQKTHHLNLLTTTHIGNPATIPTYPAITIELIGRDREPLTLEDVEDEYTLSIKTYVDVTQDHEQQYQLLLDLTSRIENALFIPIYLRIPPFFETTLDEPIEGDDYLIKTVDCLPRAGSIIIEDAHRSRYRTLLSSLGHNVYELNGGLPAFAIEGTKVIQLLVHSYAPEVLATEYGNAEDGERMLQFSEIIYTTKILRQRNKTVIL